MSGSSPQPASFELTREVRPEDIDEPGHVGIVVVPRWIQDAATSRGLAGAP
ncbi:MAG TPA: hypothetical protein VF252_02750 [Gemmatimonadales bacterium]